MTPLDRRIALLRAGITQAQLAREYGCSKVAVHLVLVNKTQSAKLQRHIARRLRLPLRQVFPLSGRRAA